MKYNKVGIICAMPREADLILRALSQKAEEKVGDLSFYRGKIGEKEVILSVCGIGKVFAAVCAQTMILLYAPDCLINSGVAGSLTDDLAILDVALAENLVQHDMDTSPLGDPVGMISGINLIHLPASDSLRRCVQEEAASLGIRTRCGTIASGDQFIANKEQKDRIKRHFAAIACEMEGAAIAQTAYLNRIPFACIRAISDSFSGQNEMDYALFAEQAAERSAALLTAVLKQGARDWET